MLFTCRPAVYWEKVPSVLLIEPFIEFCLISIILVPLSFVVCWAQLRKRNISPHPTISHIIFFETCSTFSWSWKRPRHWHQFQDIITRWYYFFHWSCKQWGFFNVACWTWTAQAQIFMWPPNNCLYGHPWPCKQQFFHICFSFVSI